MWAKVREALVSALHDPQGDVRIRAAAILGQLGQATPEVLETLISSIREPEIDVRMRAAVSLGQLGQTTPQVLAALIDLLHDSEGDVRYYAARSLGLLGQISPEIVSELRNAASNSTSWGVRLDSVRLLNRFNQSDERIIDTLQSGLKDEDQMVRMACTQALAQLGRKLGEKQRQKLEVELVQAIQSTDFEQKDIVNMSAREYAYDALWLLLVGDGSEL